MHRSKPVTIYRLVDSYQIHRRMYHSHQEQRRTRRRFIHGIAEYKSCYQHNINTQSLFSGSSKRQVVYLPYRLRVNQPPAHCAKQPRCQSKRSRPAPCPLPPAKQLRFPKARVHGTDHKCHSATCRTRIIRTLVETACCLMQQCGAPIQFWKEAIELAAYVRNCSPSKACNGLTPYQLWEGDIPHLGQLRVFGCAAHVHIPKKHRPTNDRDSKFGDKRTLCIYLGPSTSGKGSRVYDIEKTSSPRVHQRHRLR